MGGGREGEGMNQRRRLHEKRVQRMGGESGWAGIDKNSSGDAAGRESLGFKKDRKEEAEWRLKRKSNETDFLNNKDIPVFFFSNVHPFCCSAVQTSTQK